MNDFLLKLLGIRAFENGHVERWNVYFSNLKTPAQKLLFALAALGTAWTVWWFYRREPEYCSERRRRVLAGLRYGGILILLFGLAGPVLEVFLRSVVKGKVVFLVDDSKSMSRVDKYTRPEDKLVAAHALNKTPANSKNIDAAAERATTTATRMDIVKGIFANKDVQLLDNLSNQYDLEMYSFSRASAPEMRRLESPSGKLDEKALDDLQADGPVTEIGGAMRETMKRLKGQPLSAIVLLSDGGNNKGEDPVSVALDSPVRIYPVGIGVPESRDAAITYLFMENKIFVDDFAPVYVRIKQHGFSGESAQLVVKTTDGDELARQIITLRENGEQTEVVRVTPKKPGKYTYRVEIDLGPLASADSEPGNNFKTHEVEVIDQKLKVLVLESDPRWEYRFLKNSLLRDKRVECKILLRVPDMAELASGQNSVFLKEFPSREELFKYHVIVFGNLPNDGFFSEHDMENLRKFVVEEGGGIWFIAGKNNFPDSYKDTKFELLIPVEYERNPEVTAEEERQSPLTDPFRLTLTPEGRSHSVTRLEIGNSEGGDDRNASLWEMVPEMYWYHHATRPKLGATALLAFGGGKGVERGGPPPLMVTAQVGRGRVLYQAFADMWRMRYPAELGPDALERFHAHVIQYLGLTKLLGRTARVEINTDREEYAVGDRIKITARVLEKQTLDYSSADHVTAVATDKDNDSHQYTVDLTPEPGQRGMFKGELVAAADGKFRMTLKDEDEGLAHVDYQVTIPQVEMDSPDMKKELLENIAKSSAKGGASDAKARMYYADQTAELLKDLTQSQKTVEDRKENTLWDAPILLLLFTLFMGAEWFIRKRSDLL